MPPLSDNDIISEISYAYIHAVAAHAGMECTVSGRHSDNRAIDARITAWGPFGQDAVLTEVNLNIQLKATAQVLTSIGGALSYPLSGIPQYNRLRSSTTDITMLVVVLQLPQNKVEWLVHSNEELALRRCAYWVSLRNAPETQNTTSVTIKLPTVQVFGPEALRAIVARIARMETLEYAS